METSNLKNMVVLKNLPSNIVDEAIIVLKANKKTKKLQKIENKKILENQENKKDKEYILKEAEMIVNNYISKIENKENDKIIISKDTDGKYKKLNIKTGVCKVTFEKIPKGTYYVGIHSWNRTAPENNRKVFSKWSKLRKVTTK